MLDLNNLSRYHENNRIEAKRAAGGLPSSLWESYSAFANTQGGIILLGVEERADKSLCAVDLPDPEKLVKEFWDTINNRQKVSVSILTSKHVQIVESDGHRIILIDVPRANRSDKPVYIGSDPFVGSYRRNGEGDYHCTKDEVRNMMRDQSNISQDLKVLEQLGIDAFDYESVRRYRIRLQNTRPEHVWENLDDVEFLMKIACISRAEDGTLHPTAGGILMFGYEHEIIKEYSYFFLDYQEHESDDTRWTDRIVSNIGDWSGNLFDFYTRVYGRLSQGVKTPFKLERDTRQDDTPVHKAIREALVNALIHSNYYDRRGLVIHRYTDRIIIANPGGLRVSVDDAIIGGLSDPRNITLIKMFNLINIGDRAGSGIPNIFDVWQNEGWERPVLTELFNPDRTILTLVMMAEKSETIIENNRVNDRVNDRVTIRINKSQKKILELMMVNSHITAKMLSAEIGISERNIRTNITKLRKAGLVERIGADKSGGWIVKKG